MSNNRNINCGICSKRCDTINIASLKKIQDLMLATKLKTFFCLKTNLDINSIICKKHYDHITIKR